MALDDNAPPCNAGCLCVFAHFGVDTGRDRWKRGEVGKSGLDLLWALRVLFRDGGRDKVGYIHLTKDGVFASSFQTPCIFMILKCFVSVV